MNKELLETDKNAFPQINVGDLFIGTPKRYNFLYELYILFKEKELDNLEESRE